MAAFAMSAIGREAPSRSVRTPSALAPTTDVIPMKAAAAILCGIGFTMSLFIGGLAFELSDFKAPVRLGVLGGSVVCAVLGYLLLRFGPAKSARTA